MVVGCCCFDDFSSISVTSKSIDSDSIFIGSGSLSQSVSEPPYIDSDCACCYEGVLPQRYRWLCNLTWNNIFGIKCPDYFIDKYNDTELIYDGTQKNLPPGFVQCRWTTPYGFVASNFNRPLDCPACVDGLSREQAAAASQPFIPAVELILRRDGAGMPCYFEAQIRFSFSVSLPPQCAAQTTLTHFAWKQNLTTDPFMGCINNYRLKRLGMFTPNVDAFIELIT